MEVILIDQNRSDSFLLKFFLDEMDFITEIHEFEDYGKALDYLAEKEETNFQGQLTVLCTEDIRKNRGADFLIFISEEFSALNMYRILTGEDKQTARLLLHSGKIDEYLEKKIELDDFGIETNRVLLSAKKTTQVPKIASLFGGMKDQLKSSKSPIHPSTIEATFQIKNIIPTCVSRLFAHRA